ncbi:MAG: Na+/H+ antiporter subunit E [Gemmatimonadaceae bacterium]
MPGRPGPAGRLLPHPVLSTVLLVSWLLLHDSVAAGVVVSGALLAVGLPLLTRRFWPEAPQTMRLAPVSRLVAVVLWDILAANIRVARLVLGPARALRPRFIELPLAVTSPLAITTLAGIITLTPGTVSANLSGDRRTLLVHALSDDDPAATVADIKQRYERPLLEIFGC